MLTYYISPAQSNENPGIILALVHLRLLAEDHHLPAWVHAQGLAPVVDRLAVAKDVGRLVVFGERKGEVLITLGS